MSDRDCLRRADEEQPDSEMFTMNVVLPESVSLATESTPEGGMESLGWVLDCRDTCFGHWGHLFWSLLVYVHQASVCSLKSAT